MRFSRSFVFVFAFFGSILFISTISKSITGPGDVTVEAADLIVELVIVVPLFLLPEIGLPPDPFKNVAWDEVVFEALIVRPSSLKAVLSSFGDIF